MIIRMSNEEIKLNGNNYIISGSFLVAIDKSYGADADGNRAINGTWIYDFELDDIIKNEETHTMSERELDNLLEYIEENIEKFE